jgi:hypothetical protein
MPLGQQSLRDLRPGESLETLAYRRWVIRRARRSCKATMLDS